MNEQTRRGAAARRGRSRPGRPRGPRRSREERREELLDAAERAIRRIGPDASMEELAAEAGITKPILYSHFGDRAGMADALAERTADGLIETVSEALRHAAATGSAKDVTRSSIQAFCEFVEQDPSIYRFLVRNALDHESPLASRLVTEVASRITRLLDRALRETDADVGPAELWAFGMVGLSAAGAEWWLERRTMTRDELVEYMTQLLWGGLVGVGMAGVTFDSSAVPDLLGDGDGPGDGDAGEDVDNVTPLDPHRPHGDG